MLFTKTMVSSVLVLGSPGLSTKPLLIDSSIDLCSPIIENSRYFDSVSQTLFKRPYPNDGSSQFDCDCSLYR